jgi:Membrane protein involved in the export of O-antigen and teichoic acid
MKAGSRDSFFHRIAILTTGAFIAQIITLLTAPIMTRLYTSEQIGIYTIILTAISMFGSVVCGRYDVSIVTETDKKNIYPLIKLSLLVTVVFSVLISVGYSIFYKATEETVASLPLLILLILLLLLLVGVGNTLISYNNRVKDYKIMASVNVMRAIGKGAAMSLLGLLRTGGIGLVMSEIIGQTLGMGKQIKPLKPHIQDIRDATAQEVRKVARLHSRQPLFSMPAIFANNFSYSSINLFVNNLYGLTTLGYYSMSFRVLGMPLSLISMNVSKVFLNRPRENSTPPGSFVNHFSRQVYS